MAPKASSLSHQPSKEKQEREEPSSEEEEEDEEEEESEAGSSKEEKENSSDETEEGSSEDEDEDQENVKSKKLPIPAPKSDSKSISQENGLDSDPDSEGSPSDYKVQPIRKSSTPSAKRAYQEDNESQDSLRSPKKSRIEEKKTSSTPSGGGCITRLWSNEDEIAVLNGMIEFRNVKGLDPNADMGAFYNFIKGKLQVDFSRDQLRTKITRMKKRFLNALKKGENGSDPVFSKPHEDMAFEFSKKIWGGAVENRVGVKNENAKKDIVKAEKVAVDEKVTVKEEKDGEEGDFWSKYPFFSSSFHNVAGNFPSLTTSEAGMRFLKERLSLIGNVKAKELDEKWKQLIVEETELNYKMLNLMTEQVKMALGQK